MVFQQNPAQCIQSRTGGRYLIEDIIAVNILFNHPLDAPDLTFHPVAPGKQILLFQLAPFRGPAAIIRLAGGDTVGTVTLLICKFLYQ